MTLQAPLDGYVVYGGELSYFTRKLTAALHFYDARYQLRGKTPDVAEHVELRSGTHQVPVLHTPENWLIADTTPLLEMLDGRHPARRMIPEGPLGVVVRVVEEYFDEWLARTMVHFRWHYPRSAAFAANRMTGGDAEAAARIAAWGPRACRATGTESKLQQAAAEAEYLRILEAAERQLSETAYLLGERPTSVDCVMLGGLRAHTNMDPDPRLLLANYPRVVAWAETAADGWDGGGELAPFPDCTPFAALVVEELRRHYVPFLEANIAAVRVGAKAFQAQCYGETVSYLTRAYPVRSWQLLLDRLHAMPDDQQRAVRAWADSAGLGAAMAHGAGR
ncbi:MAG: glutathione S-transferase family protein [Pseudomonadales bacterium]